VNTLEHFPLLSGSQLHSDEIAMQNFRRVNKPGGVLLLARKSEMKMNSAQGFSAK
jgi:hypothetical protein